MHQAGEDFQKRRPRLDGEIVRLCGEHLEVVVQGKIAVALKVPLTAILISPEQQLPKSEMDALAARVLPLEQRFGPLR